MPMKRLLASIIICLVSFAMAKAAPPAKWTEHRRALLVNGIENKGHAVKRMALAF